MRVEQQKDDWNETSIDEAELIEKTTEFLENHLNKDLFTFVKVINDSIIATCSIQVLEELPQYNDNGRYGLVCNVYTIPEYRRNGHQKELLGFTLDNMFAKNISELKLESDNPNAIALYEQYGFIKDEITYVKEYEGENYD